MIKYVETAGTAFGMFGALLVAMKLGQHGYPVFIISSVLLLYSAFKQKQRNFIGLQSAFLLTNLIGVYNYVFS